MQVWALKSYTKSAPLYVQVLQRSSLGLISPFLDPERDVIVSVEQTRHRLLALSCLCPGASTLIGAALLPALVATSALFMLSDAASRQFTCVTRTYCLSDPVAPALLPMHDTFVRIGASMQHRLDTCALPTLHCLMPCRPDAVSACCAANLLRRAAISAGEKRHTAAGRRWLRSYLNGCAFKLFDAPLPAHLAGLPFTAACEWLYRTSGCVLIGAARTPGA